MTKSVVLDTNILISRLLFRSSTPAKAVEHVLDQQVVLSSTALLKELANVIKRHKFDRYLPYEERLTFLYKFDKASLRTPITQQLNACRDPKDNMILELAVNGRADLVITGDNDLLALNPFQEITIITPADYLESYA